ncbi:MAG: hypothetical protein K1060chlam2_00958 [Chlamydiae bacterium]|nr:hypothetical protein [Chlamydiota bacterium]
MGVPYSELKRGTLLIASPDVRSGIFFRSVVLLCDHSPVGSFGLIINKPLDIDLESDPSELGELADSTIQIRSGGPNQPNQVMLIQNYAVDSENCLEVCSGVFLSGDIDSLQFELEDENEPLSSLLCLGYGGWNSGALEREFLNGGWFLHPASREHLFEIPPENLWQFLLREMGGKYKTLSMIPEDLDLN